MNFWGRASTGELVEILSRYPPDTPVRTLVELPDLGLEVEDLQLEVAELPFGPAMTAHVLAADLDRPETIGRLAGLAERPAGNNVYYYQSHHRRGARR